jgi:hypothetical protein
MTNGNTFDGARIELAGSEGGVDGGGHLVFAVIKADDEVLYGEFFEVWTPENDRHFNIEIEAFGFTYQGNAGNAYPSARNHFSAEECAAAEKLIRSFFARPDVVMKTWQHMPGVKFLGGVTFRPGWIIRNSSEG